VLHPFVIFGIAAPSFRLLSGDRLSGPAGFVTFCAMAVAATVVLAEVSWRLVEHPMLALKRFVPRPPSQSHPE
jgi:peptidoglycan/LPS O-acetylase OafA/YrhL